MKREGFVLQIFLLMLLVGCNPISFTRETLLFRACSKGNIEEVRDLLQAGANVNARDAEGETPLMYAAVEGHVAIINLLAKKGADIDAVSSNNETALARASLNGRIEAVRTLLNLGASVDKSTDAQGTPLMYASVAGHKEVMKLLLDNSGNVNAVDAKGNTALMNAIRNNASLDVVCILIKAGADIKIKNKNDEDAASIAKSLGRGDIEKLLSEASLNAGKQMMNCRTS